MRVDLYTKIVLTVIAVALLGNCVSSFVRPKPASAQSSTDYSRLQVTSSENHLVVYNNYDGSIDVLDLNSGRHIRSWHIGDPTVNLASGN